MACNIPALEAQLHELSSERGMAFNVKSPLELLQEHHVEDFPGNTLFDIFARTVCLSNSIPRKEVFAAWAMASFIHNHFPTSQRFADLACSHGLVSWALLMMAFPNNHGCDETRKLRSESFPNSKQFCRRTSVCVDKLMPESADHLRKAMTTEFPCMEDRCDFIEGELENVAPAPSTVLVGIHCCGPLSDTVIELAIRGNSPLALAPCCHTFQCIPSHQYEQLQKALQDENCTLTDYIDSRRMDRLNSVGYEVSVAHIPSYLTPKNRIILAIPPLTSQYSAKDELTSNSDESKDVDRNDSISSTNNAQWSASISFPVEDSPQARAIVKSLSGRGSELLRKTQTTPSMCLSLLFPQTRCLSVNRISNLANRDLELLVTDAESPHTSGTRCVFAQVDAVVGGSHGSVERKYGLTRRTFRISYKYRDICDDDGCFEKKPNQESSEVLQSKFVQKHLATCLFEELCRRIQREIPGASDVRRVLESGVQ